MGMASEAYNVNSKSPATIECKYQVIFTLRLIIIGNVPTIGVGFNAPTGEWIKIIEVDIAGGGMLDMGGMMY